MRDIMTSPVLTVTPGEPASDALSSMRDASVRHAVVVSGPHTVVGIVSDRDLGGPLGGSVRRGRTVADLMQREPIVGSPELGLKAAVLLLREHRIGCLPILDGDVLVGIVTRSDLLAGLAHVRKRDRRRASETVEATRPPLLVSPNRDKWP